MKTNLILLLALLSLYACIGTQDYKKAGDKMEVYPGVRVPIAIFGQDPKIEPQPWSWDRSADKVVFYTPSQNHIVFAEKIILSREKEFYLKKYNDTTGYKKSPLWRSPRQYLGFIYQEKKYVWVNYLQHAYDYRYRKEYINWKTDFESVPILSEDGPTFILKHKVNISDSLYIDGPFPFSWKYTFIKN